MRKKPTSEYQGREKSRRRTSKCKGKASMCLNNRKKGGYVEYLVLVVQWQDIKYLEVDQWRWWFDLE